MINVTVAMINFDPKEDISGLNNPGTTSWKNIQDFSNVTGLSFVHNTTPGVIDGKLEILEPVNLLDHNFTQSLEQLGNNLDMAAREMSLNNATTALKEFNKTSRLTIYNLTTDKLVIYAIPEGSSQPVEVFNWFTGYLDSNYLSGSPTIAAMGNGNYSISFTVNHWSSYGVNETPVVNLNTNETFSSIQEAIDASNTTNGHVIYVGAGEYDESVYVDKELIIRGESKDNVTVTNKTSNAVIWVGANNVTLENLTVTDIAPSYIYGIYITQEGTLTNVTIKNVVVKNTTRSGIFANWVNDLEIRDTVVTNTSTYFWAGGMYLTVVTNASLVNVTLMKNKYVGLNVYDSYDLTIKDSHFNENCGGAQGGASLFIAGNITIINSQFNNNTAYGLYLEDVSNVTVTDSEFNNNAFNGVSVTSWGTITDINITGSEMINNSWYGFTYEGGVDSLYDLRLLSNNISLNAYSGIYLEGYVAGAIIQNNTILNNDPSWNGEGSAGISSMGTIENSTISDNTISGSPNGILIYQGGYASNNTLTNNTISSNYWGIALYWEDNTTIDENILTENIYGIYLYYSFDNAIINNVIDSNEEGIFLSSSYNNTIKFNTITNNTGDTGITISRNSGGNVIQYNNLEGNIPGISNTNSTIQVDARYNWWNSITGPSGDFNGRGDKAYGNLSISPWLDAPYPYGEPISGDFGNINVSSGESSLNSSDFGLNESDFPVEIDVNASDPVNIFAGYYDDEPSNQSLSLGNGFFYDVAINNSSAVNELVIRFYYTDSMLQQAGLTESTLKAYWFNGSAWIECSDQTLNTTNFNGWSGYLEVRVDANTTPSLSDLTGTPFGLYGFKKGKHNPVVITYAYPYDLNIEYSPQVMAGEKLTLNIHFKSNKYWFGDLDITLPNLPALWSYSPITINPVEYSNDISMNIQTPDNAQGSYTFTVKLSTYYYAITQDVTVWVNPRPQVTPTPTPQPTPTPTPVPTPTPTPTITPVPTPVPTPTPTPQPTPIKTPKPTPVTTPEKTPTPAITPATTPEEQPGFEVIFAIAGLLAVVYLLRRRH
jgi:PGF-CTERM protein